MSISQDQMEAMTIICKAEKYANPDVPVVIAEPYLPYVPSEWGGILVLGEAQNLSKKHQVYVDALATQSLEGRITRLRERKKLGVIPWDDGSLKLALLAALAVDPAHVAVSNGVLWSQRDAIGNNVNPADDLVTLSIRLWSELLPILKPTHIVTASKIARMIVQACIDDGFWTGTHIPARNPSAQHINKLVNLFREEDLLSRYPEVKHIVQHHPEWVKEYRQKKIFYACHFVSICTPYRAKGSKSG